MHLQYTHLLYICSTPTSYTISSKPTSYTPPMYASPIHTSYASRHLDLIHLQYTYLIYTYSRYTHLLYTHSTPTFYTPSSYPLQYTHLIYALQYSSRTPFLGLQHTCRKHQYTSSFSTPSCAPQYSVLDITLKYMQPPTLGFMNSILW